MINFKYLQIFIKFILTYYKTMNILCTLRVIYGMLPLVIFLQKYVCLFMKNYKLKRIRGNLM